MSISVNEWVDMPTLKKYEAINTKTGDKARICKENATTGFVFLKGKRNRGYRYDNQYMMETFTLIQKDPETKWHKDIKRAIKALKGSGLWPNELTLLQNLDQMTQSDLKEIEALYWSRQVRDLTGDRTGPDAYNAKFDQIFSKWIQKYPFLVETDPTTGCKRIVYGYMADKSNIKLKSMYFGKYSNEHYKTLIQDAIANKTKFSTPRLNNGYDVSFEYNPDKNAAWYSEEYRNCGNGHYYIALDHNLAMFVEDD